MFGWLQPSRAGSASSSSRDAGGPKHKVLQAVTYTADLSGMALVRGALTEGSTLKNAQNPRTFGKRSTSSQTRFHHMRIAVLAISRGYRLVDVIPSLGQIVCKAQSGSCRPNCSFARRDCRTWHTHHWAHSMREYSL